MKKLIQSGKEFGAGMGERKLTVYATSGCYYMFMSLVPIVMIICCILPYTPFNQTLILSYIDRYFAESLGEIVRKIVNAVYSSNGATLTVSILLTLYSASASMKSLMNGMDAAYSCKKKRNFIVATVCAIVYMVILLIAIGMSLVIMVYGGRILNLLRRYFASVGILAALLSKGRYLLVMVLLCLVFALLYRLMPADRVRFRDQLPGAVFTAVVWVIFSSVFTVYITVSDKFGAYGIIGTVMVAMMWMYYSLFFMLIGGFLNSFLMEAKRKKAEAAEAEDTELTEEPLPEEAEEAEKEKSEIMGDKLPVSLAIGGFMAMAAVSIVLSLKDGSRK